MLYRDEDTTRAAIAGFCDGDGCIYIARNFRRRGANPHYRLDVVFAQAWYKKEKRDILLTIQSYYGGTIHLSKQRRMAILRLSTWAAFELIKDCYPYMITRKPQADVALDFIDIKRSKSSFEGCDRCHTSLDFIAAQETCKQEMHYWNREGADAERS